MNQGHVVATQRRVLVIVALWLSGATIGAQPSGAPRTSSLDGRGVSLELAKARAEAIRDVRYALTLDLSSVDSAVGTVVVSFARTGPGDVILDFRGRRVTTIRANGLQVHDTAFNGHHIRLPAAVLRPGPNSATVSFVADIAPSGASIIRSHDPVDGSDYVYTLLVPADANQLFPCFDQPDLKARVSLAVRAPAAWTVLSNGSVVAADTSGGFVQTRFAETRPLSTYLLAFAAGPWTRFTQASGSRTINLYARRSRAREVDADTLLSLSHRSLNWMIGYFGRPYPFEKFDIMLAPAFPFGGMEHPGLVMYNEDRFIFRERPTLARRVGRFSTILHETAHQWFGDLVTMRWFDDLWLKEGFATYMGAKALAELEPAADAWKTFFQGNKPPAYGVDQTLGTTPLWQVLANLDQAKSAYGPIVYNKAPSVLKQLNHLVGEESFQRGVRGFLGRHEYGNATWQDLLASIGDVSNRNLDAFGRNFMLRPGMATVEQHVETRDGRIARLTLTQRAARPSVSGNEPWPMRTRVMLAYPNAPTVRLDADLGDATTELVDARGLPAPEFVYPNADDFGYFVSYLDSASVRALEAGALRTVRDPLTRAMLWGTLWDHVRDARLAPERYVQLVLRELPLETDEQILPTLANRVDRALRAYLGDTRASVLQPSVETTLWSGVTDAQRSFGVRRGMLDAYIGVARTESARTQLVQLLGTDSVVGEPVRDPVRWAIVNRLLVLGDPRANHLLVEQAARDTSADGRRRAFIAGAARRSREAKSEYFDRYFSDRTLNEDWASGSLGEFAAVEHSALTQPFLRAALDSLPFIQQNRRIFFLGSWLGAFLGGQTSAEAEGIVRAWLSDHPALPADLRQKVLQALDELERTVRIRSAGDPR